LNAEIEMRDVAIVFAGEKFTDQHIIQKRTQLDLYCEPTLLTVFTDDPARVTGLGLRDTRAVLLPTWHLEPRQMWWYKLFMFAGSTKWQSDDVLYMDLDTIIVDSVEKFYDYQSGKFCICQDFNRAFIREYPISNSSVIRFNPKEHTDIYDYFTENMPISFVTIEVIRIILLGGLKNASCIGGPENGQ